MSKRPEHNIKDPVSCVIDANQSCTDLEQSTDTLDTVRDFLCIELELINESVKASGMTRQDWLLSKVMKIIKNDIVTKDGKGSK